ncbi:MAG: histone deacetylase [Chloroflexi bacterium]|nr:MAG: histone deacetylase [Chloroflexota bacterium]
MGTGYVYDPRFLEHTLAGHPENRHRLERILQVLTEQGVLERLVSIPAQPISEDQLQGVHTPAHIARVRQVAEQGGGHLDADTYVTPHSYDVALLAAGGLVHLVEAVLAGDVDNGFALIRPPGHHATRSRGMGFCLFNNVALAAHVALKERGLERVLIVDFDVHHGNGTQDIFYQDPTVLYFSTHQYPFYPGTGWIAETGQGAGKGYTVNVPLPPGVGDEGYAAIFEQILWPVAERFRPQLILVSAGYDAHWDDPLAMMRLSLQGYAHLARELVAMATHLCQGRVIFTLEGGYHQQALAYGVLNTLHALLGEQEVVDPLGPSPHPEREIEEQIQKVKALHGL